MPVGEVLSSPYFRNNCSGSSPWRAGRGTGGSWRTSSPPRPTGAGNTVLVSQPSNLEEVGGVTLEEGEAAVYEPLGDDDFEPRARPTPEGWEGLP